MRESPKILGCRIFPSRPATKIYFPVKKLLFPTGCGRRPATAVCYDHANAATDCNALTSAESRFSELLFLEAGEPIGAREETGKRREGTVASEPTLSPTSLVLSLPGRGWRGQPSARNHWLRPMSEKPIFSSGPTLGSGSILPRTLLLIGRKIELSSLALGCGPASPAVPSSTVPLLERRQRRTEPAWNIDGTALWLVAKSLLELLRD
jgi:hypothetical protein